MLTEAWNLWFDGNGNPKLCEVPIDAISERVLVVEETPKPRGKDLKPAYPRKGERNNYGYTQYNTSTSPRVLLVMKREVWASRFRKIPDLFHDLIN